jgi:hypothetical protein
MAIGSTRGAHLGGAYVTVDANVSGFGGKVVAKMRAELKAAERMAKDRGVAIGDALAAGILLGFVKQMPKTRAIIESEIRKIRANVTVGVMVKGPKRFRVKVDVDEESLKRSKDRVSNTSRQIMREAERFGGTLFGRIASVMAGVSKNAANSLGKLKTTMGAAKGNAVVLVVALEAIYFAAMALAGAFNAVGRELTNVLKGGLALPGILAMILAVAAPMMVVFIGLGEKLKGIFDADPKKAKKALDALSGSLQTFAKELRAAKPWYDSLVKGTREAFFKNIVGIVPHIISAFGGALKSGFAGIADSVGSALRGIFDALSTPETLDALKKIFKTASDLVEKIGMGSSDFLITMRDMAVASLPALEQIGGLVGRILGDFEEWVGKKIETGEFNEMLGDFAETINELIDLAEALFGLFGAMFDEGNQDGNSFIKMITKMVNEFHDFLERSEGKLALEGITFAAKIAAIALLGIITIIVGIIAALGSFVAAVKRAVGWVINLFGLIDKNKIGSTAGKVVSKAKNLAIKNIRGYAEGGIITKPTLATFAENGPEVAIPLTNPKRARQLIQESGLTTIIGHGEQQAINVAVYIGDEQLDAKIVKVSKKSINDSVTTAKRGGLPVTPK